MPAAGRTVIHAEGYFTGCSALRLRSVVVSAQHDVVAPMPAWCADGRLYRRLGLGWIDHNVQRSATETAYYSSVFLPVIVLAGGGGGVGRRCRKLDRLRETCGSRVYACIGAADTIGYVGAYPTAQRRSRRHRRTPSRAPRAIN